MSVEQNQEVEQLVQKEQVTEQKNEHKLLCAMCSTRKTIDNFSQRPDGKGRFVTCDSCREYSKKYKTILRPKVICPCGCVCTLARLPKHKATKEHIISLAMRALNWNEDNPIDNALKEAGYEPFYQVTVMKEVQSRTAKRDEMA